MANIFDIQRSSLVDGPGIRTTVFFKGCNLRCLWCHNPESQSPQKEKLFFADKCKQCGHCRQVCPTPEKCVLCGKCALYCPQNALRICGEEKNEEDIFTEICRDKLFYGQDGGVTFSGGECMLQPEALLTLLKMARAGQIHTAVDTAGHVPFTVFEKILPYTDMFLYDVKVMDAQTHRRYTGVDNAQILENLARLLRMGKRVWVRVPLIEEVNANEENVVAMRRFFEANGFPEKIEFLPYHAMGENKYRAQGREVTSFHAPDPAKAKALHQMLL